MQSSCGSKVETIIEEILYLPDFIASKASAALKELLIGHQCGGTTLKALDGVRLPQQLQAALRQIWSKVPSNQKLALVGPLTEWSNACLQLAPTAGITAQDKLVALKGIQHSLSQLPADMDWIGLAYSILFDAPPNR